MSESKMREALNQVLSAALKYKLEESDMCVELAREALAQPTEAVELTDKQVISACYSYRHDFGLLDKEQQDSIAYQCRSWLHAINKELISPSQHPFVLATANGKPLPIDTKRSQS